MTREMFRERLAPDNIWTDAGYPEPVQQSTRWDFFHMMWDGEPDTYYEWQARLMAERAPA